MCFRQSRHPRTRTASASPELNFGFLFHELNLKKGRARLVREVTMSLRRSFSCLTALTLQMLCVAHGTFGPRTEKDFARLLPEEASQHLNTSALNTLLAFEPYQDLASRVSAEPEAQQQPNILFSPLGLASAVALLSRVSGPESRRQALPLLGLAPNPTDQSVEDTESALTNLLHNLTLPEQEGGAGTTGGAGDAGSDDGTRAGSPLKVWSALQAHGKQSDHSFLSGNQHEGSSKFSDASQKDLEPSDNLKLHNYAYFKGRCFLTG